MRNEKKAQKLRWRDIRDSPEYKRFREEMIENKEKRIKAHGTFGKAQWVGLLFLMLPFFTLIKACIEEPHKPFIMTQTPLGGYFVPLFVIGMCLFCFRSWYYEWYIKWVYFHKKWSYVYRVTPEEFWKSLVVTVVMFIVIVSLPIIWILWG